MLQQPEQHDADAIPNPSMKHNASERRQGNYQHLITQSSYIKPLSKYVVDPHSLMLDTKVI